MSPESYTIGAKQGELVLRMFNLAGILVLIVITQLWDVGNKKINHAVES